MAQLRRSNHKLMEKNSSQNILKNLKKLQENPYNVTANLEPNLEMFCTNTKPSETDSISLFSNFLVELIKERKDLITDKCFVVCEKWTINTLDNAVPTVIPELLTVLQRLILIGRASLILPDLNKLLQDKSPLLKHINLENDVWGEKELLVLSCLNSIFIKFQESDQSVNPQSLCLIKNLVLKTLDKLPIKDVDKTYHAKMVKLCLRILRYTVVKKHFKEHHNFGELLGVIQAYLFYGIQGFSMIKPSPLPCSISLPESVDSTQRKKYFRNHKSKKPFSKKSNETSKSSSTASDSVKLPRQPSDSETSDAENRLRPSLEYLQRKTRLEAVRLLHQAVPCAGRDLYGHWTQLVACAPGAEESRTLARYVLREPEAAARQLALGTLGELLLASKPFLGHAVDARHASFDTVFCLLGAAIRATYATLCQLLASERRQVSLLAQALKCASALVEATPFSRLEPGLATTLSRRCVPLLRHKDNTVRVCAFGVFEALVLTEPRTPEISGLIAEAADDCVDTELSGSAHNTASETEPEEVVLDELDESVDTIDFEVAEGDQQIKVSALLEICFKSISRQKSKEPVTLQALKVLRAISFNAFNVILPHLEVVTKKLIELTKLSERELQIMYHAARVLEVIAQHVKESDFKSESLMFWDLIYHNMVILVGHNDLPCLREVACDVLANVHNEFFIMKERHSYNPLIGSLFEKVTDEESAVRAAAHRGLGMLVSLPALQDNVNFLSDVKEKTCFGNSDKNLGVRIKAIWAMANLTETLIQQKLKGEFSEIFQDEADTFILVELLAEPYTVCVKAAEEDNDKVKCNAVRAIGNIIYLCQNVLKDPTFKFDENKSMIKDLSAVYKTNVSTLKDTASGLKALIFCAKSSSDMKVRWNACRAIGIILSGDPDTTLFPGWKNVVFPELCSLISHSSNFKVRTNAAWALSVCKSFGNHMNTLWKGIMMAFENSQHVPNHVEYSHRDALVQQLCLTFCHLAVHTDITELDSLWIEVKDYFDDISPYIKQFQERILPEKAGDLIAAKAHFESLSKNATKSNEKEFLKRIRELFESDNRYDNAQWN